MLPARSAGGGRRRHTHHCAPQVSSAAPRKPVHPSLRPSVKRFYSEEVCTPSNAPIRSTPFGGSSWSHGRHHLRQFASLPTPQREISPNPSLPTLSPALASTHLLSLDSPLLGLSCEQSHKHVVFRVQPLSRSTRLEVRAGARAGASSSYGRTTSHRGDRPRCISSPPCTTRAGLHSRATADRAAARSMGSPRAGGHLDVESLGARVRLPLSQKSLLTPGMRAAPVRAGRPGRLHALRPRWRGNVVPGVGEPRVRPRVWAAPLLVPLCAPRLGSTHGAFELD